MKASIINFHGWTQSEGSELEIDSISANGEIELYEWRPGSDQSVATVIEIATEWQICDECHGEGMSLCDGLRGVAITQSDRAPGGEWDDPEDFDRYMSGGYDTQCGSCRGSGKVKAICEITDDNCPDWLAELIRGHWNSEAAFARESAYERAMGA